MPNKYGHPVDIRRVAKFRVRRVELHTLRQHDSELSQGKFRRNVELARTGVGNVVSDLKSRPAWTQRKRIPIAIFFANRDWPHTGGHASWTFRHTFFNLSARRQIKVE